MPVAGSRRVIIAGMDDLVGQPPPREVSVIIPSYDAGRQLNGCVAAVLGSADGIDVEVVVAASGGEAPVFDDPRVRVMWRRERWAAGPARNAAAAASTGAVLVFVDADVLPEPAWLRELLWSAPGDGAVVAGSVENGTPTSHWGTVEHLVQFLDLVPTRPSVTAVHGATCNLLVPRSLWEQLGPWREDLGGGEDTLLTGAAVRAGRFLFAPAARVRHLNRTAPLAVLRHQLEFGRFTARLARADPALRFGCLQRSAGLAPVAVAGRVVSILVRARCWRAVPSWRLAVLTPSICCAVAAWGAGLAIELVRRRPLAAPWDAERGPAS